MKKATDKEGNLKEIVEIEGEELRLILGHRKRFFWLGAGEVELIQGLLVRGFGVEDEEGD